jgi:5-methylcytosine-specific restriction endonuclease McrA
LETMVPGTDSATFPIRPSRLSLNALKPTEAVRLLNSTQLGTVTSERQLYRDRQRAGFRIGDGRRIDLIRFAAWLAEQRHSRSRRFGDVSPIRTPRSSDTVTVQEVHDLLVRQDFRCALTGEPLSPGDASMDHILAVSRGGPHTIGNAQILRRDVNRAKGTLTNEEFIALCRAVVRHVDAMSTQSAKEPQ